MKIICNREALTGAFSLAASIAPQRSPKEILQNVKLTAAGGSLTLAATDMEVGVRTELAEGVEIEVEGTALLPVSRTMGILREATDETLTLETDESGLRVSGSRSRFRLPGNDPDEFPSVKGFEEEKFHQIPTRLFREMIRRTVFATDPESSRYALGGVLFELTGEECFAVGTDGRRLARMSGSGTSIGDHATNGMTTIVPTRAISLIQRAIQDDEETIDVASIGNELLVRMKNSTIFARLVEGRYPPWRQVLPTRDDAIRIDLTVGPIFSALRQAAVVTDQESRGVDFTFGDGTLKMEASTAEVGDSQVEMPIAYDGEPVTMTIDHRYFSDFCKVLDAESEFRMEIESGASPALLTTEDGYAYVIMPMARDR